MNVQIVDYYNWQSRKTTWELRSSGLLRSE